MDATAITPHKTPMDAIRAVLVNDLAVAFASDCAAYIIGKAALEKPRQRVTKKQAAAHEAVV